MNKLIDTHFHLDFYKNHDQIYQQINNLQQHTLCVTNSPGVYLSCRKLYPETQYVKFALGFHPQEMCLSSRDMKDFQGLLHSTYYVGEVGLDYSSKYRRSQVQQRILFDEIVNACSRSNKLMSVHLRQSEDDAIEIIRKYYPKKCIIHWFTGNLTQLDQLIKLGCYFSLNTNMVKTTLQIEKILRIPIERILIESDGPFTKVNGNTFVPALLADAYSEIAEVLDIHNFSTQVHDNFNKILKIKDIK